MHRKVFKISHHSCGGRLYKDRTKEFQRSFKNVSHVPTDCGEFVTKEKQYQVLGQL